jgi:sugar/nucleoside kinase (ribokinase family)
MVKALVIGTISEAARLTVPKGKGSGFSLPDQEKILAPYAARTFGGGGLTISTGLSRLGLDVTCVGAVGSDTAGGEAEALLRREKVRPLLAKKKIQTGLTAALHQGDEIRLLEDRGANSFLKASDLARIAWKKYSVVALMHLSGESDRLFPLLARNIAKQSTIFWSPGTTQVKNGVARYASLLKRHPIVIFNRSELARFVRGQDQLSRVKKLFVLGAQLVVITEGSSGVSAYEQTKKGVIKKIHEKSRAGRIVDRIGAGDAFFSGFAKTYIATGDVALSVHAGSVNAASKLAQVGETSGLMTWQALKRHIYPLAGKRS